jgi:hypothetical protein
MEETRTQKYKEYRKSILKEDAPSDFSSCDVLHGDDETTTLPFDQVIDVKEEEKKFDLIMFFRKHAKIFAFIAIGIGLCLLIVGIILWAINVWRV